MSPPAHSMPFGATLTGDGVRFRLWAPAAGEVAVKLERAGDPELIPMHAAGDGWFETSCAAAGAGSRYCYRIDGGAEVPDPASRCQAADVHGPSVVIDPDAYSWRHPNWRGRPWRETVLYELHVGTFTAAGDFDGVRSRLDHLIDLGVTALELMPIADFSGRRNWGYDGVLPYAPASAYGTPEDLKRLIDEAHGRDLMVFLDVVYNHFGPDGNYLHTYAPQFFTDRFTTPWGAAIDFSRREVRDFVVHNVLYWLEEFRVDGLRLDAVHAIIDDSSPDILEEIAATVHRRIEDEREVHLVLENEHNTAHYLAREEDGRPRYYVAQWNDDIHHAFHCAATGESAAYYADYADQPIDHLCRCLSEGFAYQGEPSLHRSGRPRGTPSAHLPATAFVSFIQNHDQVGNRAFGERITALAEPQVVKPLAAIMLLAPSPPMLFMGEEWGAAEPFLFFCDFHDALADSVREGRRREFARFPEFRDAAVRATIPDPNAVDTFKASRLDWTRIDRAPHAEWFAFYRGLLELRAREIVPRLAASGNELTRRQRFGAGGLYIGWTLGEGDELVLIANLSAGSSRTLPVVPKGRLLYAAGAGTVECLDQGELPPWSAAWFLT